MKKGSMVCVLVVVVMIAALIIFVIVPIFLNTVSDEFIETYAPLSRGIGVEKATPYNPNEEGPHPIVLISYEGDRHGWTDNIPNNWRPDDIRDVELVVLCDEEQKEAIEVCYYNGPDITRYQYYIYVTLREAKTGKRIEMTTLYGSLPRECRRYEDYDLTVLYGSHVSVQELFDWLEPYVF